MAADLVTLTALVSPTLALKNEDSPTMHILVLMLARCPYHNRQLVIVYAIRFDNTFFSTRWLRFHYEYAVRSYTSHDQNGNGHIIV